jgi:cyclic pyranopterin phosphate synthase
MPDPTLTHLDPAGKARMVNVTAKTATAREAMAEGFIEMHHKTLAAIADGTVPKGEVLGVARLAGIMAAKRTGDLIPLCHPLPIESIELDFDVPALEPEAGSETVRLYAKAVTRIVAKTGVEMEALTAVSLALLTVYDMCKAIDKTMTIGGIKVVKKTGGKSDFGT